jgi:hypothetical protein
MGEVDRRIGGMTAEPIGPGGGPDTGSYEVIHLGEQAAVVVPLGDFLRLRALEQRASAVELEDAEDAAAVREWRTRESEGRTSYVGSQDVRGRLGLER